MKMLAIREFRGKYRFLSNFWPTKVKLDGKTYKTVEHAYQAAKSLNPIYRKMIHCASTPAMAKQRGCEPDAWWQPNKEKVMLILLRQKFGILKLREKLIATYPAKLIEGNTWDIYWGVYRGKGQNRLGLLLMQVRKELM